MKFGLHLIVMTSNKGVKQKVCKKMFLYFEKLRCVKFFLDFDKNTKDSLHREPLSASKKCKICSLQILYFKCLLIICKLTFTVRILIVFRMLVSVKAPTCFRPC